MALKKCISFRKGFSEFTFESDPAELSTEVIQVCSVLSKGFFITEVFSQDPLRDTALQNAHLVCQEGNLCYYLCKDVDFLKEVDLASARHIGVYSVLNMAAQKINGKYIKDHFAFCICFENYLDTSRLTVCRKYYADNIASALLFG